MANKDDIRRVKNDLDHVIITLNKVEKNTQVTEYMLGRIEKWVTKAANKIELAYKA